MKIKIITILSIFIFVIYISAVKIHGVDGLSAEDYIKRYASIKNINSLSYANILEDQVFNVEFENFGSVTFVPLIDVKYGKIIICLADKKGKVLYKTDSIEGNYQVSDTQVQPNTGIAATAFYDMNGDGLKDIAIILSCTGKTNYKISDVLFQRKNGFYSDEKITDTLNKYDMNHNIETMRSYINGENSKEFLYTSDTLKAVKDKGFKVKEALVFSVDFEEFGRVAVVPGFYAMGGLRTSILYIVDANDKICYRLDSMKDFDDLVELKNISFIDVNNDGLKDISILADYRYNGANGFSEVKTDYTVFFQNLYSFERNYDFENSFTVDNTNNLLYILLRAKKFMK